MHSFFITIRNTFLVALSLILSSCVSITFDSYGFEKNARKSFIKTISLTTEGVFTGSGVVVDHINDSYSIVITAGHVCKENSLQMAVLDYLEKDYGVLYMASSESDDLCAIITTEKIPVPAVSVATFPINIGDKVYNIAAPMGIHSKNMALIFEGYYSGNVPISTDKYLQSAYTVPTMGGSSGSPLFNHNWELVGIMARAYPQFQNVGIAVSHERVNLFIKIVKEAARKHLKQTAKDKLSQFLLTACQETHFCKT